MKFLLQIDELVLDADFIDDDTSNIFSISPSINIKVVSYFQYLNENINNEK